MAFVFDTKNPSTPTYGTGSQVSHTHTCAPGTGVLVVLVAQTNIIVNRAITQPVTYNGVAMHHAGKLGGGCTISGEGRVEIWYMLNPPTGSAYTVSVPNSGNAELVVQSVSFTVGSGKKAVVDTIFHNGSMGTASANPSATAVVSSDDSSLVIAGLFSGYLSTATVSTTGGVDLFEVDSGVESSGAQYLITSTAGGKTISWTQSSDDWYIRGIVFREVDESWTGIQLIGMSHTVDAATATTFTLTHRLNIAQGDVLVAIVSHDSPGAITDNNGSYVFTEVLDEANPAAGAGSQYAIYTRVAGASEPSSYMWTTTVQNYYHVWLLQFRGVDTTNIWDVAPSTSTRSASSADGTTATSPSMTTNYVDSFALLIQHSDNQDDWAVSAVNQGYWNQPWCSGDDVNNINVLSLAFKRCPTATTYPAASMTLRVANDWVIHQVALRKAVASGDASVSLTCASASANGTSVTASGESGAVNASATLSPATAVANGTSLTAFVIIVWHEGHAYNITWTESVDLDGDAITYEAEFSASGSFDGDEVVVFSGVSGTIYEWTLPTSLVDADTDTCRLRLRARDEHDAVSSWSVSIPFAVINAAGTTVSLGAGQAQASGTGLFARTPGSVSLGAGAAQAAGTSLVVIGVQSPTATMMPGSALAVGAPFTATGSDGVTNATCVLAAGASVAAGTALAATAAMQPTATLNVGTALAQGTNVYALATGSVVALLGPGAALAAGASVGAVGAANATATLSAGAATAQGTALTASGAVGATVALTAGATQATGTAVAAVGAQTVTAELYVGRATAGGTVVLTNILVIAVSGLVSTGGGPDGLASHGNRGLTSKGSTRGLT